MFLPEANGIICDHCGLIQKDKFKYYSTRSIKHRLVSGNRTAPVDGGLNSDMCSNCYDNILKKVKANLGPYRKNRIKCDLSKTYKAGSFEYYIIYFDLVNVDKELGENAVKVEKNVMDLNVINGFDQLLKEVQVTKKKVDQQGSWT